MLHNTVLCSDLNGIMHEYLKSYLLLGQLCMTISFDLDTPPTTRFWSVMILRLLTDDIVGRTEQCHSTNGNVSMRASDTHPRPDAMPTHPHEVNVSPLATESHPAVFKCYIARDRRIEAM